MSRDTPVWKLEPSFRRRSCAHAAIIRRSAWSEQQGITPYKWVHPDEERW